MDLRKLKDKATDAFAKGKFAKAAELYEAYCAADPKDLQARLRMGDAWSKAGGRGARDKAIDAYKSAAEGFAKEGFLPRAIAASKLILELDPAHQGVQQMLASLYAHKGAGAPKRTGMTRMELPALQATQVTAPATGRYAPIELPPDEPKSQPLELEAPVPANAQKAGEDDEDGHALDLDMEAAPAGVDHSNDLPPELDLGLAAPAPAPSPPAPAAPRASGPKVHELPLDLDVEAEAQKAIAAALGHPVEPPTPSLPARSLGGAVPAPAAAVAPPTSSAPPPAAPAFGAAPPGLRPKTRELALNVAPPSPALDLEPPTAELELMPHDEVILELTTKKQPSAAETSPLASEPPRSRIWLPGAGDAAAEPVRNEHELSAAPAAGAAHNRELERTLEVFSRFDELDFDMPVRASTVGELPALELPAEPPRAEPISAAPAKPQPPAGATAVRIPSFTELELDGDSLLHAVEMAAVAGASSRGEATSAAAGEELPPQEEPVQEGGAVGLPKIPLFSDLPADAFIDLFDRCPLKRYTTGERIVSQGSVGDAFYVICAGAVSVVREDDGERRELATLNEGAFFGEMALLSGAPRTASVDAAAEETQVLEISAPVLAHLSHRYPQVAQALKKFVRQRLLNNVMNTSALFKPFDRKQRKNIIERFRARDVKRGDVLIREGAPSDGLYVVLSGEVDVTKGGKLLATLREGEIFGEMSLLQKTPATATVSASKRTSLLRLPRPDFDTMVAAHPKILELIAELSSQRAMNTAQILAAEGSEDDLGEILLV